MKAKTSGSFVKGDPRAVACGKKGKRESYKTWQRIQAVKKQNDLGAVSATAVDTGSCIVRTPRQA